MASVGKIDLPNEHRILEESKQSLVQARTEYDQITSKKKEIFAETLSVMTLIDKEMKLIKAAENELTTNKAKQAQIKGNYDKFVAALNEVNTNTTHVLTESNKIAANLTENKAILDEKKHQLETVKNEQYQILYDTAKINKDIQVLKEQIEKDKNDNRVATQTITTLNTQIEALQRNRNVETTKIAALSKTMDEHTKKIEEAKQTKEDLEKSITLQQKNMEHINASLVTAKKEYDVLISFKATLNGQIDSVKDQHANERAQIKNIERSLSEISKVLEKERKTFQDLNTQLQKKTDVISAGKAAIDDINAKIVAIDEETAKQELQIKESTAKINLAKVEKKKDIDDANAGLVAAKSEYDALVSSKNEIVGKIEFTKVLLVNERTNIKNSENALVDITRLIEKEKKTVNEVNTKYQSNVAILSAGKKTVDEILQHIATVEAETAKNAELIKDTTDKMNVTNAALASIKKEYDGVVSEKTALNSKIVFMKDQLTNERSQAKAAEKSLADMTVLIEKEKKSVQDLNNNLRMKHEMLNAEKEKIQEIKSKIVASEEASVKQELIIKDIVDKMQATNAVLATVNKEYDAVASEKALLSGQIATVKGLIANERLQIKNAENSINEINRELNNDKRTLQDLNNAIQKKNDLFNTGKKTIEDLNTKLARVEAESLKHEVVIKDNASKLNAAQANLTLLKRDYDDSTALKNEISGKLGYTKELLANERTQIMNVEASLSDINKLLDKDKRALQEFNATLQKKNDQFNNGKKTLEDIQNSIASLEKETENLDLLVKDKTQKLNITKLEKEAKTTANNIALAEINRQYSELVAIQNDQNKKLADEQAHIKNLNKTILDLNTSLDNDKKTINELNGTLYKKNSILNAGKKTIDDITAKIKNLEEETEKQGRLMKENIDKLNASKLERDANIDANNAALAVVKKEYDELVSIKNSLNIQISTIKGMLTSERTQVKNAETSVNEINALIEKENKTLQIKMDQINVGNKTIEDIQTKIGIAEKDSIKQIAVIKENIDKMNASKVERAKVIDTVTAELAGAKMEYETLGNIKNKLIGENESVKGLLANEKAQIKTAENSFAAMNALLDKDKKALYELNARIQKNVEQLNSGKATMEDSKNRITAMEEDIVKQRLLIQETKDKLKNAKLEKDAVIASNNEVLALVKKEHDETVAIKNASIAQVKKENDEIVAIKNGLSGTIASMKAQIAHEQSQVKILEKSVNDITALLDKEKKTINELTATLQKKTEQFDTGKNTIQDIMSKISVIEEDSVKQGLIINERIERMNTFKAENNKNISDLNTSLAEIKKENDDLVALKNDINVKIDTAKKLNSNEQMQVKTAEKVLLDVNASLEKNQKTVSELNNVIDSNNKKIEDIQLKITDLEAETIKQVNIIKENTAKQASVVKENIEKLNNSKADRIKDIDALNAILATTKKEYDELVATKNDLTTKIDDYKKTNVSDKSQIKIAESTLTEVTLSMDKDKKILNELTIALQKKTDLLNNGNNTIADIKTKITAIEEDTLKHAQIFKENIEKLNALKIERDLKIAERSESDKSLNELRQNVSQCIEITKTIEKEIADTIGRKKQIELKQLDLTRNLQLLTAAENNNNNNLSIVGKKISTTREEIEKQKKKLEEENNKFVLLSDEYNKNNVAKNELLKKVVVAKEAQKEISSELKSTQLLVAEIDSKVSATKVLNKELIDSIASKKRILDTENRYTETTKLQIENILTTISNTKETNVKMGIEVNQISQELRNIMNENTQMLANKSAMENQLAEFKRTIATEIEIIKKHEKELALANKKLDDMNSKKRDVSVTFDNINKSIANSIEETKRITNDINNQDGALSEVASTLAVTREKHETVKKNLDTKQKELMEFKQSMTIDLETLKRVEKQISEELLINESTIRKYTKLQCSLNELTTSTNKHAKLMDEIELEKENLVKQTAAESMILEETKNSLNIVKVEFNALMMSKKIITTELFEAKAKMAKEIEQINVMEKSIKDTNVQIEYENKRYNEMSAKYALNLRKFNNRKEEISNVLDNMSLLDNDLNIGNDQLYIEHDLESDAVPEGLINQDIKIYILCHNEQCFNEAPKIYGKYSWAVPILMTYQDITFENAFWKQLYEMRAEWYNCKMVGTLSFRASKKINLSIIDNIIRDPSKWTSGYYHFLSKDIPVNNKQHPNLVTILNDVTRSLRLDMPNENCCNYWMCSPDKMLRFLIWFEEDAYPLVMSHSLSMTNSTYIGSLKKEELLKLGPYPFYTHAPFVFERLFISYFKKICYT